MLMSFSSKKYFKLIKLVIFFEFILTFSYKVYPSNNCIIKSLPYTNIEAKYLLKKWAQERNIAFEIMDNESSGMEEWKNRLLGLEILLFTDSPIASTIKVCCSNSGQCKNLLISLTAWMTRKNPKTLSDSEAEDQSAHDGKFFPRDLNATPEWPSFLHSFKELVTRIEIMEEDTPIQLSGLFLVDKGLVLTTAHEIEKVKDIAIEFSNGFSAKGEIKELDTEKDLALIKIIPSFPSSIAIKWGNSHLEAGVTIYTLGFPFGQTLTLSKGIVVGPRNMKGQILMQVDLFVAPGSSGSPVFDSNGNFVGIIKGRLRGNDNQGFIIPLLTIKEFMDDYFYKEKHRDNQQKPLMNLPIFHLHRD